jgi:hypothetical protein
MPPAQRSVTFEYDKDAFRRFPKELDATVQKELAKLGRIMVKWMRSNGPKDTSISLEALQFMVEEASQGRYDLVVESAAPNSLYSLETGRGPGMWPNKEKIMGWVSRRGISSAAQGRVRKVGKAVATTYRKRKVPRGVDKRLAKAAGVSMTSQIAQQAFLVARHIALHGTEAPRLFTRAVKETEEQRDLAMRTITRRIARLMKGN